MSSNEHGEHTRQRLFMAAPPPQILSSDLRGVRAVWDGARRFLLYVAQGEHGFRLLDGGSTSASGGAGRPGSSGKIFSARVPLSIVAHMEVRGRQTAIILIGAAQVLGGIVNLREAVIALFE